MRTWHKIGLLIALLAIVIYAFIRLQPASKTATAPNVLTSVNPTATIPENANIPGKCHIRGVLPDELCTPGAADPRVTQDNIMHTICVSGYTKTVRPPVSYTDQLKTQQIASYGYADTNRKDYEEDHLISLELGGSPTDPKNLWPEPGASPNPKDKIENLCHEKVCSGQISLSDAQHEIATDWLTACQ